MSGEKDPGPAGYDPTPREVAAIQRWSAKKENGSPAVHIKVKQVGPHEYGFRHDHKSQSLAEILLEDAIGSTNKDFRAGLLQQLLNATANNGKVDETFLNFAFAVIKGLKPVDEIETMLAAQMAAVHLAMMHYSARLALSARQGDQDRAEVGVTKLARTFAAQIEALKRYRSKGEQVVRVERVYVGEGGRAIVGNVSSPGGVGSSLQNQGQTHGKSPTLAAPDGAALPITLETNGQSMRECGGARQDPMPLSRRKVRRAKRQSERPQARS